MIVTLRHDADVDAVRRALAARGLWIERLVGVSGPPRFLVATFSTAVSPDELRALPGVEEVAAAPSPHPRFDAQGPRVTIAGIEFGGPKPVVMAGPCSVESEAQIEQLAGALAPLGVHFLRGGAFKPRTSPYAFQGHGDEALVWMRRAADRRGLKVVTEAMSEAELPLVAEYADLVQIGSRNMQNFALLKAAGRTGRPVMLKRGVAATVQEWLLAGEYLLVHGAASVVLCERGIRGFDPSTRNLLDLGAVALLAHVYKVPVIVDPSHATGRRDLIAPLARAAVAAGAAGVMIESHASPGDALSDGPQALEPAALGAVLRSLGTVDAGASS